LLANVSHDLRTPLNAILGYTEMLREGVYGPLSGQQHSTTGQIINSTGQLLNFVDNLLNQAQIESGKIILKNNLFAPTDLIEAVRATMKILAEAKGLALTFDIAPAVPPTLCGDAYWLRQILLNLIGNAIKFTEQGTIHVSIHRAAPLNGGPGEPAWVLQVADTGCGVPAEAGEYIFEAFRQVDGTTTRLTSGSGLGLAIVKQLTTLMGGQVSVESQEGQGSTFTVRLPLIYPVQEDNP
jgi:signal transduction histidine kinase